MPRNRTLERITAANIAAGQSPVVEQPTPQVTAEREAKRDAVSPELLALCAAWVRRCEALGYGKGLKRDKACLEFFCGASEATGRFVGVCFLISVRGHSEVTDILSRGV